VIGVLREDCATPRRGQRARRSHQPLEGAADSRAGGRRAPVGQYSLRCDVAAGLGHQRERRRAPRRGTVRQRPTRHNRREHQRLHVLARRSGEGRNAVGVRLPLRHPQRAHLQRPGRAPLHHRARLLPQVRNPSVDVPGHRLRVAGPILKLLRRQVAVRMRGSPHQRWSAYGAATCRDQPPRRARDEGADCALMRSSFHSPRERASAQPAETPGGQLPMPKAARRVRGEPPRSRLPGT
jgi:hypothetical protein